jgi:hypothetical protein
MPFHPSTCRLHGGVAAVATALKSYDDRGGCCPNDHEEEIITIDYFIYIDT